MVARLRVLPDYGIEASYNVDTDEYLEIDELPLTPATQKAFQTWQDTYDEAAIERKDLTAIHEQGRQLTAIIQKELGSDYNVFYGSSQ